MHQEVAMRDRTLCFLIRGNPANEVLLGFKKIGFGAGKYAGFGGKVEAGETVAMAAARELEEETGIRALEGDLLGMGHLTFLFPASPCWSQMVPVWFSTNAIPFQHMWQDAAHWLPRILARERIRAWFTFKDDNETIDQLEIGAWDSEDASRG